MYYKVIQFKSLYGTCQLFQVPFDKEYAKKKKFKKLKRRKYSPEPILNEVRIEIELGSGVAQLVERSLPIPEVRGSNPVIGKNLFIY